jgi:uncharacterized protein YjeT (DUF2065 family)
MTALAGPFLIVCTILGLGGLAKLWAPLAARRALRAASVEVPLAAVRLLGLAEVVVACIAIFRGGTIMPILVGMTYLAFAAFVIVMLRSGEGASCGCFGSASAPPSILHVVVNVLSAAAAFGAVGVDGLMTTLDDQAGAGIALLVLVVVGSYALFLLLTALPVVLAPPQPQVASFSLRDTGDPA